MFSPDSVLHQWINPRYLDPDAISDIRESVWAKPTVKYAVLDDFFRRDKLDILIAAHATLKFSEEQDRRGANGVWLPYDGAVNFASRQHVGADLFYAADWHVLLCLFVHAALRTPAATEIKLRYHRPFADGFWIHTDSTIRSLVAITYFNKGWGASDGGLLQLWRVAEDNALGVPVVNSPTGRMDCLNAQRLHTASPGGGFADGRPHDLILIDQIVPTYNRLFVCNFELNPAYHSVTPSNGRDRTGMVQWLHKQR